MIKVNEAVFFDRVCTINIFIALNVFTVRINGNYTLYSFYMTTHDILAESQKLLSYLKHS